MKKALPGLCVLVLLFVAGAVFSLDTFLPGDSAPKQIVTIRKFAMQSNVAILTDLKAKVAAGTLKAVSANARALASVGSFLPAVFTDPFSSVYPVEGNKFFFKAGAAADFRTSAQNFTTAAEDLIALADKEDRPGVDAQVTKLQSACGACHGAFRGSY